MIKRSQNWGSRPVTVDEKKPPALTGGSVLQQPKRHFSLHFMASAVLHIHTIMAAESVDDFETQFVDLLRMYPRGEDYAVFPGLLIRL